MNEKGFTLIEVIVSIALLAFIGVAVGISLNRTLKDNAVTNYNEFVEKVKSASMLYVNNTPDVINGLNEDSFKVIKVKELIDNGYIKDNLKNPDTGEKINPDDKVKISYNSDNELTIEYPYTNDNTEPYLYTLNYTTTYGNAENDICYQGLNTPSLQLINKDGTKVHDLVENKTIKAYMEDGTECTNTKINASKIGTYKIRYDYTTDESDISSSNNVKSADRTITIKSSKPEIKYFNVTRNSDIYNPTISFEAVDVVKMQYCITLSKDISSCNNWKNIDSSSITETINLKDLDSNITSKNTADINLFVKNTFEEYSTKNNSYPITFKITIKLNGGTYNNSTNDIVINNVGYNEKISKYVIINNISKSNHKFMGLNENKDGNGTSYDENSLIVKDIVLYAQWYEYCINKTYKSQSCTKTCGGGVYVKHYVDTMYPEKSCDETTTNTCNTQACYVECSETYIKKVCEKYSDWPIQYHAYKYDINTGKLCESWWTGESCSLSGGGGSSGITCVGGTERTDGRCDCSDYIGNSNYQNIRVKSWIDANGINRCCCGN